MFGKDLTKHIAEIRRYIRNWQFELSPTGLFFPRAKALVGGVYSHAVNGAEVRADHNIIPDEGLNHFLNVVLKGPSGSGTQVTTWYLALHSGSGTPNASATAANYSSTYSEITSGTEGYSEATRVQWVGDAVDTVNTEVVNDASPADFTIVTASTLTVRGAALLSVSTKGSTSGVLLSAGKFSADRNLANGDTFSLKYKVDLDAV